MFKILSKHYLAIALVFMFIFQSCQKNIPIETEVPVVVIDNKKIGWVLDGEITVEVDSLFVSKELSRKVGTFFSGVHKVGRNFLLVDRYASNISCLSPGGELIWFLIPPSPGQDRYTNIGSVDIDYITKEIYVEDRSEIKIDIFSFTGEFLRDIRPTMNFMDFAISSQKNVFYDIAQTYQEPIGSASNTMRYLMQDGQENTLFSPLDKNFDLDAIPFNDNNRFCKVGEVLYHRLPFEDLVYRVEKKIAYPVLKVAFEVNNQYADVGLEKSVENKASYLYNEEIPRPLEVILDEPLGIVRMIFAQGRRNFFSVHEGERQVVSPARHYNFSGFILPAPRKYDDGKFYLQIYRYHYDLLQRCYRDKFTSKEEYKKELNELYNKIGDNDDILIFTLEF